MPLQPPSPAMFTLLLLSLSSYFSGLEANTPIAYTVHPYEGTNLDPCQGQGQCHSPCPHQREPPAVRLVAQEVTFDHQSCLLPGSGGQRGGREGSREEGGRGRKEEREFDHQDGQACSPDKCLQEMNYVFETGEVAVSLVVRSDVNDGERRQLLETQSVIVDVVSRADGTAMLEVERYLSRSAYNITSLNYFTHILLQGVLEGSDYLFMKDVEVYVNSTRLSPDNEWPGSQIDRNLTTVCLGKTAAPRVLPGESRSFVGAIKTADIFYRLLNSSDIIREYTYAQLLAQDAVYPECLCGPSLTPDTGPGLVCLNSSDKQTSRLTGNPPSDALIYPSVYGLSDGLTDPALPYGYWLAGTPSYVMLNLGAVYEITRIEIIAYLQALQVLESKNSNTLWYSLLCTAGAAELSANCTKSISWEGVPSAPYHRLVWEPPVFPSMTDKLLVEFYDGPNNTVTLPYPGANPIYEVIIRGRLPDHKGTDDCMCFPGNSENNSCEDCGQCPCRDDAGDVVLAGKRCTPYVSSVSPSVGPLSGGTLVTLHGGFLNPPSQTDQEVTFGQGHWCKVTRSPYETNDTMVVCHTSSVEGSGDNSTQRMMLYLGVNSVLVPLRSPQYFTYLPDPRINHVTPMETFLRGGIRLTVTGRNFNGDLHTTMNIMETTNGIDHEHENDQECMVHNSTMMFCLTPPIHFDRRRRRDLLQTGKSSRPRRELRRYLNTERRRFVLVFDLAGNKGYQRFPTDNVTLFEVYEGPKVYTWTPQTQIYKVHEGSEHINIYGQRLRDGCGPSDYTITIGDELCRDVRIGYDNQLVCSPPARLDNAGARSLNGASRVRVRVGNLDVVVGYLRYHYSMWDDEPFLQMIIGVAVAGGLLLLLVPLMFCGIRRCRRQKADEKARQHALFEEKRAYEGLRPEGVEDGAQLLSLLPEDLQDQLKGSLIEVSKLKMQQSIGKGNFGKVFKGTLECENGNTSSVAVKTLHDGSVSVKEIVEFLKEATIMRDFSHPHVLTMHGVVLDAGQAYVVLPYMDNGDLKNYLPKNTFTCGQYLQFCRDAASGMAYLADHKFVHRDLAARNCMVDRNERVLVADFGLARDIYEKDYYRIEDMSRPMPYKWMALEALSGFTFSSKSDVWSFGILVWEVFTRGRKPYADVENRHMRHHLTVGNRLEQPNNCPDSVYNLMRQCWQADPEVRPTFHDLVILLEALIKVHPVLNRAISADYADHPAEPDDSCEGLATSKVANGHTGGAGSLLRATPSTRVHHNVRSVPNAYTDGPGIQPQVPEQQGDDYLDLVDGPEAQTIPKTYAETNNGQNNTTKDGDAVRYEPMKNLKEPASSPLQDKTSNLKVGEARGFLSSGGGGWERGTKGQTDVEDYLQPVDPPTQGYGYNSIPTQRQTISLKLNTNKELQGSMAQDPGSPAYLEVFDDGYLAPVPPPPSTYANISQGTKDSSGLVNSRGVYLETVNSSRL